MTVLYPASCYIEICYKRTVLLLCIICSVAYPEGVQGFTWTRTPLHPPPPPPPPFLNILWKWNNLVSVRPNYFIFMGHLRKLRENYKQSQHHTFIHTNPLSRNPIHPWCWSTCYAETSNNILLKKLMLNFHNVKVKRTYRAGCGVCEIYGAGVWGWANAVWGCTHTLMPFYLETCHRFILTTRPPDMEPGYMRELTLYSLTPFDTFEISCILRYCGKWSICSFGAYTLFCILFSKVFKI